MLTALITGADRGLGLALCKGLLERGFRVFAGQYASDWPELKDLSQVHPENLEIIPLDVSSAQSLAKARTLVSAKTDRIDLLVNNAGVFTATGEATIREKQDFTEMRRLYDVNTLGPIRVVEALLGLTGRGSLKRLCFVSSDAGSIANMTRRDWYGYCMSKAALNMAVKIMFNQLRPDGYTFRLYHPGWMRTYMHGEKNLQADLEADEAAVAALSFFLDKKIDEDSLELRDWQGKTWPW